MYAQKIFPRFLLYDSLSEVFENLYSASCSQLDKGTPLSARRLRREPLLKRVASCVHIVRPCLVFSLSFPGFPLSLSFLCFFFSSVIPVLIFLFVMFGLFFFSLSVMFGLDPDILFLDCRIKSGNDSIIFFPLSPSGLARGLLSLIREFL